MGASSCDDVHGKLTLAVVITAMEHRPVITRMLDTTMPAIRTNTMATSTTTRVAEEDAVVTQRKIPRPLVISP